MKSFTAGKNDDGVRLSRFVQSVTSNMPTSLLYKSFRNKRIKINGKKADADARICQGDLIELYINDEFFAEQPQAEKPVKKQPRGKLKIIYEDENFAVIYKPVHMLCHSDRTGDVSLVEIFCDYLAQKGEYDESTENTFSPAVCNRLDRGTEGLVLAAKNYAALRDINAIIKNDLISKKYLCITAGTPKNGVYNAFLRHDEKNNKVTVRENEAAGFKSITTGVTVLKQKGPFALCEIDLITGRTHQIRAHLSYLGCPVLGDIKYGNRKMNERCGFKTQALCAEKLIFKEIPAENTLAYMSGKEVSLESPEILKQFERL